MTFQVGSIDSDGLAKTSDGKLYVTLGGGSGLFADGSQTAPSIAFASDTSSGFYKTATSEWGLSLGGSLAHRFSVGNYTIFSNVGAVTFGATPDTTIGRQAAGRIVIQTATATPAGGSASGPALCFGSTSGFGIYIGSGVPTVSAAQGSLYLRSDGSSTSTRLYVNTNGTTGWTNVTTAA